MNKLRKTLLAAVMLAGALPGVSQAGYVLNTGAPSGSGFPLSLDGSDFYAAEFALGAGQTITSIAAYITGGDTGQAGDTFTVALYSASGSNGLFGSSSTPVYYGQATYNQDGFTGLSNLNISGLSAGDYWAAFEVGTNGDNDSTLGLLLPTGASGTPGALGYAYNDGGGYQLISGETFGVQVSAVPLPNTLVLLASGLLGLGIMRMRRGQA